MKKRARLFLLLGRVPIYTRDLCCLPDKTGLKFFFRR